MSRKVALSLVSQNVLCFTPVAQHAIPVCAIQGALSARLYPPRRLRHSESFIAQRHHYSLASSCPRAVYTLVIASGFSGRACRYHSPQLVFKPLRGYVL
jgi:hypothetical protein